jgi:glyoxylase-like metal-dependent hydrolase (beta-lactamase superfamily II)
VSGHGAGRTQAWTEFGAHPVAHGVHRVPLPLPNDGLHAVNVYVLEEPDGLVLIDAGWALLESRRRLEAALASIGHDLGAVRRILVTHVHRDHYTQAISLRRLVGARVELGMGERPGLEQLLNVRTNVPLSSLARLRESGADGLADALLRQGLWDDFDGDAWALPDGWITSGEIRLATRTLLAIPTPGHTQGHVVFLDGEAGLLFAGDHVLPHITPSIGFELGDSGLPLGDYLDSLRLVTKYPDARLLPAHGPVTDSVHGRVDELMQHHDARLEQSAKAVGDRAVHAFDVASRLTWTRRHRRFAELDLFNQMLAVSETAAHLDLLVARGVLTVTDEDGTFVYAKVASSE